MNTQEQIDKAYKHGREAADVIANSLATDDSLATRERIEIVRTLVAQTGRSLNGEVQRKGAEGTIKKLDEITIALMMMAGRYVSVSEPDPLRLIAQIREKVR